MLPGWRKTREQHPEHMVWSQAMRGNLKEKGEQKMEETLRRIQELREEIEKLKGSLTTVTVTHYQPTWRVSEAWEKLLRRHGCAVLEWSPNGGDGYTVWAIPEEAQNAPVIRALMAKLA